MLFDFWHFLSHWFFLDLNRTFANDPDLLRLLDPDFQFRLVVSGVGVAALFRLEDGFGLLKLAWCLFDFRRVWLLSWLSFLGFSLGFILPNQQLHALILLNRLLLDHHLLFPEQVVQIELLPLKLQLCFLVSLKLLGDEMLQLLLFGL